jgi:alpha-glucosidase
MNLKKTLLALRALGLKKISPTVQYSRRRDRLDMQYRRRLAVGSPETPGELVEASRTPTGALLKFQKAGLDIAVLASDLVRLDWSPGLPPLPYAISRQEWPETHFEFSDSQREISLTTDDMEITTGADGSVVFAKREPAISSKGTPFRIDEAPQLRKGIHKQVHAWTHLTRLAPEECIYGLGERAAPLNRRGGKYLMWNTDPGGSYGPGKDPLYISIPAYVSLHSGGSSLVFYENSFKAEFSIGSAENPGYIQAAFEDGMLRYYVMVGPPERLLERFSELTGRAALPPRWALGYHQCRWGYKEESDVRRVVEGFRENQMPLSAVHLDIDYMDGYRVFTVDKDRFPDLSGLVDDISQQGIKVVTILDPGVKVDPDYEVYEQGLERDAFVKQQDGKPLVGHVWPGRSVYPDFTNPQTRQWWAEQYTFLLDRGAAGVWHDMNEPTSFTGWGDMTLPLASRHVMEGRGGDHREAHNLYGLLMNRAGWEALHQLRPDRRPWIITRAGWAGMQRYAWNWTGDTETSWEALRMTVPQVLSMGLGGVPFSGPDIGGFSGDPSAELYLRWFQLASFLPYFRTHSSIGTRPREPWTYGEPYTSILRQVLHLRYRLLPYLYTLAWEASQGGIPPVRPLFWADAQDPVLWEIDDAFLLGRDLLAAPALEEGAKTRQVRLPAGRWYEFWSGQTFEGSRTITIDTPLENLPFLVRAGSILPMEEEGVLTLHIFPGDGGEAEGQLYSDEGDGYGSWRLDHFRYNRGEMERSEQGDFPYPYQKEEVILHSSGKG